MSRGKVATRQPQHPSRPATGTPARTWPAWLAPAVYALITVLLFREFFFAGGRLLGTDTYALSYFARNFYTEFVQSQGRFPLWDPYLFGGLPFVEGMHGDIFYPPSLALFFMDARTMWGWKMVLHVFLAGIFCYLWLRQIRQPRPTAFFGGLVYMVGADLVSLVLPGGDGKLFVSALAPLMFLLTERLIINRRIADFAFFALGMAAVMFTSHMQLVYFTVWGVSLYFLFRLVQTWRAERQTATAAALFGGFALAGLLGVAAAAVQFVPPLEYLREWSHRTERTVSAEGAEAYRYSTSYSLNSEEIVSLVVPEFVGDNAPSETRSAPTYWGKNDFKINHEYAGLIPLVLLPLLLLRRREPRALFFMALALIALLYALGASTPAFRLFYLIPGVRLFRAPSLIIFLYGLSIATLAALALQRLLEWTETGREEAVLATRALWIVAGGLTASALLVSTGAFPGLWQATFGIAPGREQALAANLPNIRAGFWIAAGIAAAVAGSAEALKRGFITWRMAVFGLALLAVLDTYRVNRNFITSTVLIGERGHDPALFQPDETIRFLQDAQARGEVFRAFNLQAYEHNVLAVHGIEEIAGHHGNELARYRRLIGGEAAENVLATRLQLLDLLNGQYLVVGQRVQDPSLEEVFVGSRSAVYRKIGALPRAYLVGETEVLGDDQALTQLLSPDFDAARTAVLADPLPPGVSVQPEPQGTVEWIDRGINAYTLRVQSDRPALLVISENHFPAWQADVDGQPAPLLRANLTFRAVPVPAGEHTVRLSYHSAQLRTSATASVAILAVLLAVGVGDTLRRRRAAKSQL